ncbi:hypothetical protein FrEUN1fDRAFT_3632 [Parafrankia sp. EUN1f]|nr:hypothetical protein FrEUN1fDRAFT_3632 [Parafrankia sp. EUN1f]
MMRVVPILGALVGVVLTAGCGALDMVPGDECTGDDRRFAKKLDALTVLEIRPSGASLIAGGASHGCSDSTAFPYASRWYHTGMSAEEIADFYRDALPAAGWKLRHADPIHAQQRVFFGARLCFTRPVDGIETFLSVGFPGALDAGPEDVLGSGPADVDLHVMADPEDGYVNNC